MVAIITVIISVGTTIADGYTSIIRCSANSAGDHTAGVQRPAGANSRGIFLHLNSPGVVTEGYRQLKRTGFDLIDRNGNIRRTGVIADRDIGKLSQEAAVGEAIITLPMVPVVSCARAAQIATSRRINSGIRISLYCCWCIGAIAYLKL